MQFPELAVFDLDACFYNQETFELDAIPRRGSADTIMGDLNGRGRGVIGVRCGGEILNLHAGSLYALQQHYDRAYGNDMKMAFASSALTPFAEDIARASLQLLEVVPGTSVWDLVVNRDWNGTDVNQIGRQPPLSSNKAQTHFPILRQETGIRFDRMLFFDDCNWGDHCGAVRLQCKETDTKRGPVCVRTPNGLGIAQWKEGLRLYANQADALENNMGEL